MTLDSLRSSELVSQHRSWKEARARIAAAAVAEPEAKPEVPKTYCPPPAPPDPDISKIESFIESISHAAEVNKRDLLHGISAESVASRSLALGVCVLCGVEPKKVSDFFGVFEESVCDSADSLRQIYRHRVISIHTSLNESLPLIWRDWTDNFYETNYATIKEIQTAVCRTFGVSRDEMISSRRMFSVVLPRQIAMALCRRLTLRSLPEIGRKFGGRDHTTVLHATRKMSPLILAVEQKVLPGATVKDWANAIREEVGERHVSNT